jgi:hypothetical protein
MPRPQLHRRLRVLLAVAVAAFLATARTATAAPIRVGIHVGASSPTGDFGDSAELGLQGSLSGTWMMAPGWGIGADVGYLRWNGTDQLNGLFREGEGLSGATPPYEDEVRLQAIQLTAHGLYRFPTADGAVPWLKGGMGLYVLSSHLVNAQLLDLDASKSYFGLLVGAGLDFPIGGGYALGLEAGYQRIHLGHFDPADFDPDNWYVLRFEDADTFHFGVNVSWGAPSR